MKNSSVLMLSLFFLAACDSLSVATSTGEHASASTSSSSSGTEVTLSGDNGHAYLGTDEIILKDGDIMINGKVSGHAPSGSTVKYAVKNNVKSLYINGTSVPLKN